MARLNVVNWFQRAGKAIAVLTELPPVQDDEDDEFENVARSVISRQRIATENGKPALRERSMERLPPGQKVTQTWPRLDDGKIPSLSDAMWSVSIEHTAGNQSILGLDALVAMPMREMMTDIHCVTGWSRLGMNWKGVQGRVFAEHAGLDVSPGWIMARSVDGYCANMPMARFMDDNTMLAIEADGLPLSREHGGPVRLLIPSLYLWKSVKWLAGLKGMDQDCRGTWEDRGYHNGGDPWLEERWRLAEMPEDGYP